MTSIKSLIEILIAGERSLTTEETKAAFGSILSSSSSSSSDDDVPPVDPIQVGALLVLLRARGETSEEIAGMVRAMNDACHTVPLPSNMALLDIVGTGGDGADTINISTAAVVLAASAGCIVAKAGNRSVSSQCGSADVLEKLGIKIDLTPDQMATCVQQCGVTFMFAPINHPAMKHVAPIRKALGVRTVFNVIGPMTNAAAAQHAVIGVFQEDLLPKMALALQHVGRIQHAVIIHGCGLDEISPLGPSKVVEIRNTAPVGEPKVYHVDQYELDPLELGVPRCTVADLKGGGPDENAIKFQEVLQSGSHTNAMRDAVVLNAGVGCYVYGLAFSIKDGCDLARTALEAGKAEELLQKWIQISQEIGAS